MHTPATPPTTTNKPDTILENDVMEVRCAYVDTMIQELRMIDAYPIYEMTHKLHGLRHENDPVQVFVIPLDRIDDWIGRKSNRFMGQFKKIVIKAIKDNELPNLNTLILNDVKDKIRVWFHKWAGDELNKMIREEQINSDVQRIRKINEKANEELKKGANEADDAFRLERKLQRMKNMHPIRVVVDEHHPSSLLTTL